MSEHLFIKPRYYHLWGNDRKATFLGNFADTCLNHGEYKEAATEVLQEVLLLGSFDATRFVQQRPNTVRRLVHIAYSTKAAEDIAEFVLQLPHRTQASILHQPGFFEALASTYVHNEQLIRMLAHHSASLQVLAFTDVRDGYENINTMFNLLESGQIRAVVDVLPDFCPKAQELMLTSAHLTSDCPPDQLGKMFDVIESMPAENQVEVAVIKLCDFSEHADCADRTMGLLKLVPPHRLDDMYEIDGFVINLTKAGYGDAVCDSYLFSPCTADTLHIVASGLREAASPAAADLIFRKAVEKQIQAAIYPGRPNNRPSGMGGEDIQP